MVLPWCSFCWLLPCWRLELVWALPNLGVWYTVGCVCSADLQWQLLSMMKGWTVNDCLCRCHIAAVHQQPGWAGCKLWLAKNLHPEQYLFLLLCFYVLGANRQNTTYVALNVMSGAYKGSPVATCCEETTTCTWCRVTEKVWNKEGLLNNRYIFV